MNDQNQPIAKEPLAQPATEEWKTALDKNKNMLKTVFDKFLGSPFYKNKKIFWPVTIFLGLVLIIVVTGLLFGKKQPTVIVPEKTASPTPFIRVAPTLAPGSGLLYTFQERLLELKKAINSYDPGQDRLQPPSINFDIKF